MMKLFVFLCGFSFIVVDFIFFLYKIGELMLDVMIRLYFVCVVCYEIFKDEKGKNEIICMNLNEYLVFEDYI